MSLSNVEIVEKVLVMLCFVFVFFYCGLVLWGSLEKV